MVQRSSYRSQRRRRRVAHAAAQRADAHEAMRGLPASRETREPLAGMARVPWTRRRIHLRCGAVCPKDACPQVASAIWAQKLEKYWLARGRRIRRSGTSRIPFGVCGLALFMTGTLRPQPLARVRTGTRVRRCWMICWPMPTRVPLPRSGIVDSTTRILTQRQRANYGMSCGPWPRTSSFA